jgi:uncharacterized protein YeaO (DUF488 family)
MRVFAHVGVHGESAVSLISETRHLARDPPSGGRIECREARGVGHSRGDPGEEQATPMAIRVVRLGSPRTKDEGLRLGTVRRPPRGVPKTEYASRDIYDVWLPDLAPTESLLKEALRSNDERSWKSFARRYRAEMKRPEAARLLTLLAALSHDTNFSVGCYCAEEDRCHRSLLRALLIEHGARLA